MVPSSNFIITFSTLLVILLPLSDGRRCFECRSDVLLRCGDPFFPSGVPTIECSHRSTYPTIMCYKASSYIGGQYVTVRGCAPFNTEEFSPGFQRAMSGTYWNGRNHFALCDYDNCNGAPRLALGNMITITTVALVFTCLFNAL